MTTEYINICLSKDQALVLFEWLCNLEQSIEAPSTDSAEQRVLWLIESQLERALPEPLAAGYLQLLEEARRKVLAI